MEAPATVVLAINGFFGRGGTETQIVAIATGLRKRGREVVVLSRWPIDLDGEHAQMLHAGGVDICSRGTHVVRRSIARRVVDRARVAAAGGDTDRLEAPAWAWQGEQLQRLALMGGVVVHEIPYFGRIPTPGLEMHVALRVPVVHTILGTPVTAVIPAAAWAVLTSDGAPQIEGHQSYEWIPCTSIGGGRPAENPKTTDGPTRFLYVGRLVASKGVDVLLAAMHTVPWAQLTVVGDGPELDGLRGQSTRLAGRVTFAGSLDRERVLEEIGRADVLVVPSVAAATDGMPTVIAEALSQGCPVLATAVGGVPQVLGSAAAPGWLVQPDDVEALAAQMLRLDREEIERCASRAPATFSRLLHLSVVLDSYEETYRVAGRTAAAAREGR
jgi:glycosyltransferase involved in cell wall biosynthesis